MMIEEAGVPRRLLVWSRELTSHQSHICRARIRADEGEDDGDDADGDDADGDDEDGDDDCAVDDEEESVPRINFSACSCSCSTSADSVRSESVISDTLLAGKLPDLSLYSSLPGVNDVLIIIACFPPQFHHL